MCFGSKKDNIQHELPVRPAQAPPAQPTYASGPKSKVPISAPVSPMTSNEPFPQQQQQQNYFVPQSQMGSSSRPQPGGYDVAPPQGPPPSQRHVVDDYSAPMGPPPSHRPQTDDVAPPPGPPPSHRFDDVAPPSGPPPSHNRDEYAAPSGPPPGRTQAEEYMAPPPGPPPSHGHRDEFAAPPGPPPGKRQEEQDYMAPPSGPPPAWKQEDDYAMPPPGPPPSQKPQHDWETLVPDTSLFPPPPDLFSGFTKSPTSNATEAEAEAGEQWCAQHALHAPLDLDPHVLEGRKTGSVRLIVPEGGVFRGKVDWIGDGVWKGKTDKKGGDTCLIAYPPLYAVKADSPLVTGMVNKTIYYEVKVGNDNPKEVTLALGYTALPYPNNRMPGWHRGSLAVHGDDGHKYINDRWGGQTFTEPMKRGETYGIGIIFTAHGGTMKTDIFYTRQGREVGRWNLHEETDAEENLPVTGLEGYNDLSCAVGTYQETSFEVIFNPAKWLYQAGGF